MTFDETNWRTEKIITLAEAEVLVGQFKKEEKKIVTVNGSFDLLHAGHLDQLEEGKKQGDIFIVGLNSDRSVREGKGPTRPLLPERARAAMLAALSCVDYVILLDEAYDQVPHILLEAIKPDIHVNGPDYGATESWIEWPTMKKLGVKGYTVKRRNNLSTSAIIEKIRQE